MKKKILLGFILMLVIQFVAATDLEVEKTEKSLVIISEMNDSVLYEFSIHNPGSSQMVELYSFVGVVFEPKGKFNLSSGDSIFDVRAWPGESYRNNGGSYNFEYILIPDSGEVFRDTILMKIVKLKNLLEFESDELKVGDGSVKIKIKNTQDVAVNNLKLKFSSSFFNEEKVVSLTPFGTSEVILPVKGNEIDKLTTGSYEFNVETMTGKGSVQMKSSFNYVPKEDSTLNKLAKGLIIRKTDYVRTNTGNVPVTGKIEFEKDVFSRLFAVNSIEPDKIERRALLVKYSWERNLQPGESFNVASTTNYTLPFVIILLVIIVALLVKIYSRTNLVLDKRVSFVKARGGELALKVSLHVKAKKYVENVQIIDRLPGMAQLYEKFGIRPDKIDSATKRLFWNVERLNAGEERVYSYIIFSKVNVVGRFELPSASAVYLRDGKSESVVSNRAFFVAEQARMN